MCGKMPETWVLFHPSEFLQKKIVLGSVGDPVRMFLGLPDQDPLVGGTDPDPSIIKQKK
jgi:hypothetical protein